MPITHAIKKYGVDSFIIKSLCECSQQEELDLMEIHYANELKTFSPTGYNLRAGQGKGVVSESLRKKISIANIGKIRTAEAIHKMSVSHLGKPRSEITNEKAREFYKNRSISSLGPIASAKKLAKDYVFRSPDGIEVSIHNMRQFCQQHQLSPSKMSNVATGKRPTHKGWTLA